jgi:hypothetical protein
MRDRNHRCAPARARGRGQLAALRLYGELDAATALALLTRLLQIRPQDRDVRDYVEHIEKPKARPDEAWAWAAKRFLPLRHAPAQARPAHAARQP